MTKLGGALIGYGIKKRNGEEKKVIFDKPIHNTITKHCLNNLLTFDGTNATPTTNYLGNYLSLFVKSSQVSNRYGVINYCGLGNGTGETSVNDTALKHGVGTITDTKKTGAGWCGSTVDANNATVKYRISHTHNIEENFSITEIGLFNRDYVSGTFTLSARIKLDSPIEVENGDTFYSIYELSVTWQDVEKFGDLAGLGGGYKVNGLCYSDYRVGWPMMDTNGLPYSGATHSGSSGYSYPRPKGFPIWCIGKSFGPGDFQYQYICKLSANWDKLKPFYEGPVNIGLSIVTDGSKISNIVIDDYVQDTFRRDVSFLLNPGFFGANTYGILVNGTLYRFGSFDENDNFTPTPITINDALKITVRQSWSTDLLTPAG